MTHNFKNKVNYLVGKREILNESSAPYNENICDFIKGSLLNTSKDVKNVLLDFTWLIKSFSLIESPLPTFISKEFFFIMDKNFVSIKFIVSFVEGSMETMISDNLMNLCILFL